MDERYQPPQDDTIPPTRKLSVGSDLPVYIFALVATVVIVSGLFAWLRLDPVPPPSLPLPPVSEEFP